MLQKICDASYAQNFGSKITDAGSNEDEGLPLHAPVGKQTLRLPPDVEADKILQRWETFAKVADPLDWSEDFRT